MTNARTLLTLLLGLALVPGAALAATGAGSASPHAQTTAALLVSALRATDGSHDSLQALAQLISAQRTGLTPAQEAALAGAGPVAPNHASLVKTLRGLGAGDGFRAADAATRSQAEQLGVTLAPVAIAAHARPSDALAALAASEHATLSASDVQQARDQLDTLPPAQAAAVASTVDAFVAMHDAAARALAADPQHPDWGETLSARLALLDAISTLDPAFPSSPRLALGGPVLYSAGTYSIDLSGSSRTYGNETHVVFSLDVGGDDTYLNNAGGNWVRSCESRMDAAAFIDISGNDIYSPAYKHNLSNPLDVPRADECGKNGGALDGVGFLLDEGGSNTFGAYQSRGVNGGADDESRASLGFLASVGSNGDRILAGDQGTNGGAARAGVGLLVDAGLGANDIEAGSVGTNGGAFAGNAIGGTSVGMLVDLGGVNAGDRSAGSDGTNGGAEGNGNSGIPTAAAVGFAYGTGGSWQAYWNGVNGGGLAGGAGTLVTTGSATAWGGNGANGGAQGAGSTGAVYGVGAASAGGSFGVNGGGADGGHGTLVAGSCWCSSGGYGGNGGGYDLGTGFLYAAAGGSFSAGGNGGNGGGDQTGVGFLLVGGLGGWAYDGGGSDGFNGGASNSGVGALVDAGASDASHSAGGQGTNGGGYNLGNGLSIDAGGRDFYSGGSEGVNGGGFAGGTGNLVDVAGDDTYSCSGSGCNGNAITGGGLLLDVEGADNYNGNTNWLTQTIVPDGAAGARIDLSPV